LAQASWRRFRPAQFCWDFRGDISARSLERMPQGFNVQEWANRGERPFVFTKQRKVAELMGALI
jgi:hypothetical protein